MIEGRELQNTASMAETPGLCVASMKNGIFGGMAGTIAIFPVARIELNTANTVEI